MPVDSGSISGPSHIIIPDDVWIFGRGLNDGSDQSRVMNPKTRLT